jgi:hypothetical protein
MEFCIVNCGGSYAHRFSLPRPLAVDTVLDAGMVNATGGVLNLPNVGGDREWRTVYCMEAKAGHTHQFLCPGPLVKYFLDKGLCVDTGQVEYRYTKKG